MRSPSRTARPRGLPAWREFLRSVLVSALSFSLDFAVCWALVRAAGFGYLPATVLSFTSGTVLNYVLCSLWVFGRGDGARRHLEFIAFLAVSILGLLLNSAAMLALAGLFGLHFLLSRVLSAGLVFFFNYACRKFLVFSDRGPFGWAMRLLDRLFPRGIFPGREGEVRSGDPRSGDSRSGDPRD